MRDGKPIEILHIVGTRPVGGIGALLKNINTSIDLNKFHFTYVFSADSNIGDFDNYVRKLGSDIVVYHSYHLIYLFSPATIHLISVSSTGLFSSSFSTFPSTQRIRYSTSLHSSDASLSLSSRNSHSFE